MGKIYERRGEESDREVLLIAWRRGSKTNIVGYNGKAQEWGSIEEWFKNLLEFLYIVQS